MIINDLQRADYLMLDGQAVDIERGITVDLEGQRQVVVCRLRSGATALQFRKGALQTSALHLQADVARALLLGLVRNTSAPEVFELGAQLSEQLVAAGRSNAVVEERPGADGRTVLVLR